LKIGIFGSSGQARETVDICLEIGYTNIFFVDLEEGIEPITGFNIIKEAELDKYANDQCRFVIGIGDSRKRKEIYKKFSNLIYINVIHPSVTLRKSQLYELQKKFGNIIYEGARFSNNIKFGNFGLYNFNVTVSHDCVIEDYVTISPGVNIAGNVHLHEEVFLGIGASVINGKNIDEKLHINKCAYVAAGAVVTKDIDPFVRVKGVPAK